MSLNNKRRIFRPGSSQPRRSLRPALGGLLAAAGGAAILLVATEFYVHSPDAPAQASVGKLTAEFGRLAVLDGDTLRVGDQVVRLEGIAAPRRGSICHGAERTELDCGSAAANALALLLRGTEVSCSIHGHDSHGRPIARCLAGTTRLSEAMGTDGWARAEAPDLRKAEASARGAARGIWRTGS